MGQFESGRWISILLLYFFFLFLITFCITGMMGESQPSNPFGTSAPTDGSSFSANNTDVNFDSASTSYSNFKASIAILTGFDVGEYGSSMPSDWAFVFSFLVFWIPAFMLAWSIYMALPWVH